MADEKSISALERASGPAIVIIMEACLANAEAERELREGCGGFDPSQVQAIELECPDYLAHSCQGCVEFYECKGENTRCEDGGLVFYSGCSCPSGSR